MAIGRELRGLLTRLACRALFCSIATVAAAQEGTERAAANAAAVEATVEPAFDCAMVVHGQPRFDEFSRMWLVAYSAAGPDCDSASDAIRERAEPLGLVFFRRPDAGQVRAWIARARREVGPAFGCPIVIRGEPTFDEATGYWMVTYSAAGPGCDDASEELGRRGEQMQVYFVRAPARQDLLR